LILQFAKPKGLKQTCYILHQRSKIYHKIYEKLHQEPNKHSLGPFVLRTQILNPKRLIVIDSNTFNFDDATESKKSKYDIVAKTHVFGTGTERRASTSGFVYDGNAKTLIADAKSSKSARPKGLKC
jgi:hypothetical protein